LPGGHESPSTVDKSGSSRFVYRKREEVQSIQHAAEKKTVDRERGVGLSPRKAPQSHEDLRRKTAAAITSVRVVVVIAGRALSAP